MTEPKCCVPVQFPSLYTVQSLYLTQDSWLEQTPILTSTTYSSSAHQLGLVGLGKFVISLYVKPGSTHLTKFIPQVLHLKWVEGLLDAGCWMLGKNEGDGKVMAGNFRAHG